MIMTNEEKLKELFENDEVIKVEQVAENEIVKYYKSGKKERLIQFAKALDPKVKSAAENSIDLSK